MHARMVLYMLRLGGGVALLLLLGGTYGAVHGQTLPAAGDTTVAVATAATADGDVTPAQRTDDGCEGDTARCQAAPLPERSDHSGFGAASIGDSDAELTEKGLSDTFERGIVACDVEEEFSGAAYGWVSHIGLWYIGSEYLYTAGLANAIATASYTGHEFGNFRFAARLWRSGCETCANRIIFRGTPDPIEADGSWHSAYFAQYTRDGLVSVFKRDGSGSSVALLSWTECSAVSQGDAWNTLSVEVDGIVISFFVNGRLIWSGTDSSLSSGRVGVGAFVSGAGSGEELRVDWVQVCGEVFSDGFESGSTSAWAATAP